MRRLFIVIAVLSALILVGCNSSPTAPFDPNACAAGTTSAYTATSTNHVALGTRVTYSSNPPCIGQHYGRVVPGGVYTSAVAPEYWVHDLEHGAIVMLYDCSTGCTGEMDALEAIANARPPDARGRFCWLLSPYNGMGSRVAVIAWGWVYQADCIHEDEINAFIDAHYRRAPEDFAIPMP